jgi:hypothetical protein
MFSLVHSVESMGSLITFGAGHNDSELYLSMSTQSESLIQSETTVPTNIIEDTVSNTSLSANATENNTNSTTTVSPNLSDPLIVAGSENRLRWVDFRRTQSYPPRMPAVQGIPSGFRNPLVSNPVFNPGMPQHFTGFGGSSTQPVGFGGSVVMSNHYGPPPAISVRRPTMNITRVERESYNFYLFKLYDISYIICF